jgi:hypothetical protein
MRFGGIAIGSTADLAVFLEGTARRGETWDLFRPLTRNRRRRRGHTGETIRIVSVARVTLSLSFRIEARSQLRMLLIEQETGNPASRATSASSPTKRADGEKMVACGVVDKSGFSLSGLTKI